MARPIFIQLGLFGGQNEIAGTHIVAAHTRVLADGSEVFVGEHVRWDRGRKARLPALSRDRSVPADHPSLFDVVPEVRTEPAEGHLLVARKKPAPTPDDVPTDPLGTDPDAVPTEPGTCPFGMPGATQLHFWDVR